MSELHPDAPDPAALKRRVLLTAVVVLALFLTLGAVADATGGGAPMVIGGFVLIYVLVMRPMMKPVREALALRRALAFRAWQEQRGEDRT
jgi:fatty acid desaturase